MTGIDPRALVEIEIEAPASEIPELTQANLIECLRYAAFAMCGKGLQEDYASDAMSMAIKEIERLREELLNEMPVGIMRMFYHRGNGIMHEVNRMSACEFSELPHGVKGIPVMYAVWPEEARDD